MPRPLSILHIASFAGNIGDNANHMGFRPWLEALIDRPVSWTRLEMREFYWRERRWDETLVDFINTHDLLVIGGGNYFELWVESSPTGTSVAIEPTLFDRIRVPVFFNALGVDPGKGVAATSRERFAAFLDKLTTSEQYLVSVRNDGAMDNLKRHIGEQYAERVHDLPDHGFFLPHPQETPPVLLPPRRDAKRIVINIACDMGHIRFAGFEGRAEFTREMAAVIERLADGDPRTEFYLIPHIFSDLEVVSELIGHLGDRLRRTRLAVAPFGSGDDAARQAFALYRSADLVMGMRFHSNVCSMALGRQVLGLRCYLQIENLYTGLGQTDRLTDVSKPGFADLLVERAERALQGGAGFSAGAAEAVANATAKRAAFEPVMKRWLGQLNTN
ncbi:MAG TPA: polysaccharide pyruvyl transferase family protein [Rhizobiaceae bacterium]|nr:polysaccharide pyruvyl transferase family protein [Rhizobiaceae bacterium]